MNRRLIEAAYTMVGQFKRGEIPAGKPMTGAELEMLEVLCNDLLPAESFSIDRAEDLMLQVARADTRWNRATQEFINEFYALIEEGNRVEAKRLRSEFVRVCPSAWYRGIAKSL